MIRHVFTLDLIDDDSLIAVYDEHHAAVWPEIKQSITDAGILEMEIYRLSNRLFMIMEVNDTFSFEAKALADSENPKVLQWEELMWNYQQALPYAADGEKWMLMKKIFAL
ncbi:MAG: L-rhamnose mutarotase [Flavobacterium sp.]|nr:MAG: L-rhamnose mutarotase [Flavobacterium sp.]